MSQAVPPTGGTPSSSNRGVRVAVVVIIVCVIAIVVYMVWAKFYQTPAHTAKLQPTASSSPAPSSLGGQIYDQSQNVIGSSLPQTNPFQ